MLVNYVLMLTVLLGMCGLAVDIGMFELKRLQMQNAADAAALSGMLELERNNTSGWQTAAAADATQNGFTQGVAGATVTLTNAPAGTWATDYSSVQAVVSQPAARTFSSLISTGPITISASSVAYATPCAYFMGSNPAVYSFMSASNGVYATCPLYVNSSLSNDYFANTNVRAVRVSGVAINSYVTGNIPTPYFGVPAMADPLAYVTSPTFTACTLALQNLPTITPLLNPSSNPRQLYPDTYCGGINILDGYVNLNPGVYIIAGGMSWIGATVTGTGVTIFLTKGGLFQYGQFTMAQDSVLHMPTNVTLSAPTTGNTAGIVIFGDRNWVSTNSAMFNDIQMSAATFNGDGIWYVPALTTNIQGVYGGINSQWFTNNYGGIVTQRLYSYSSTIHWYSNYSSLPGGNPFRPRSTLVQ